MTTTGNELETIVADVLQKIGYEVLRPDGNRDDLIIKKGKDVAVIEVKGVKGSAAEKHAAQLMKWVNNYHIDNDINPKGILIVNSFKDLPILERKEKTFPNQMLPYCEKMGFCLISTSQLLHLFIKYEFNGGTFEDIHNRIFNCNGPLVLEEVPELN